MLKGRSRQRRGPSPESSGHTEEKSPNLPLLVLSFTVNVADETRTNVLSGKGK
jgi:hypothetical protein